MFPLFRVAGRANGELPERRRGDGVLFVAAAGKQPKDRAQNARAVFDVIPVARIVAVRALLSMGMPLVIRFVVEMAADAVGQAGVAEFDIVPIVRVVAVRALSGEVVWRSVRGPNSPMPAPVRAGFVFGAPEKDDDDD